MTVNIIGMGIWFKQIDNVHIVIYFHYVATVKSSSNSSSSSRRTRTCSRTDSNRKRKRKRQQSTREKIYNVHMTEQYGIQLVFALRLCAEHILSCIHSNYEVWVPSFLFVHTNYTVCVCNILVHLNSFSFWFSSFIAWVVKCGCLHEIFVIYMIIRWMN